MQALSITDCPIEPHLLVLVKVKTILAKRPSHACLEICVRVDMVCGHKSMLMMLLDSNQL